MGPTVGTWNTVTEFLVWSERSSFRGLMNLVSINHEPVLYAMGHACTSHTKKVEIVGIGVRM